MVDGREDDEADTSKSEAQRDKGEPQPRVVRREAQDQQHDGARDVGRDRVQVRLDGRVAQLLDDDGQEERDRLQRHAQAHLDGQDDPAGRVLEDAQRRPDVEFLADDRRRVDLDAVEGEFFLLLGQEPRRLCVVRQEPKGEDGEEHRARALDDEQVAPILQGSGVDVEDAKGEETAKGVGDRGRRVEYGQSPG